MTPQKIADEFIRLAHLESAEMAANYLGSQLAEDGNRAVLLILAALATKAPG